MTIEIIICTRNRPKDLTETLQSILNLLVFPQKITIVDSGSDLIDIAAQEINFRNKNVAFHYLRAAEGLTHQRNVGIQHASCDLVLFLDDDVTLEKDYVAKMVALFDNDTAYSIGGATGHITNGHYRPSLVAKYFRKLFFLPLPSKGELLSSGSACPVDSTKVKQLVQVQWLSGCNMVYRMEVFASNLFDEELNKYSYCEDVDFSCRVGKSKRLVYEPSAKLEHHTSPQSRLTLKKRYAMLVRNHHYLFGKNIAQSFSNKVAHYWSLIGICLQALLLQRSMSGFRGAAQAFLAVLFNKEV